MNETLKRGVFGAIYVSLIILGIYNSIAFKIIFPLLAILSVYEFSKLIDLNKYFAFSSLILMYTVLALKENDLFILLITLLT